MISAASEVTLKNPLPVRCFGKNLVVWRKSDGVPVAMIDRCPHRSAKLSIGTIKGDSIECPFHGFTFDDRGHCTLVPETGKAASKLNVETFHIVERHGFIWIWHGNGSANPAKEVPWFQALSSGKWSYSQQVTEWPTHITRCIENQLDYAHLPFVHKNTIGSNIDVTKPVKFEDNDDCIRFYPGGAESNKGFIEYRFPNIWMLSIVPGKFAQMMAFVPVSEELTKLYLRGYQSFVTLPGLSTIIDTIMSLQSKYILNQDRAVVLSQHPLSSIDAKHELLYPSDTAIKMFRNRWLETRR